MEATLPATMGHPWARAGPPVPVTTQPDLAVLLAMMKQPQEVAEPRVQEEQQAAVLAQEPGRLAQAVLQA